MKNTGRWIYFPGVLSVLLIFAVFTFSIIAAFLLDTFAIRTIDGGSLTTMFPGFVYANALILKVTLFEGIGLAIYMLAARLRKKDAPRNASLGALSVILPTAAPLIGALVILAAQVLVDTPSGFSLNYFSQFSRMAVFSMMGVIALADVFAIWSLVRREKPVGIAVIGLGVTLIYWILFRYWEFYMLGFDQDRWNEI